MAASANAAIRSTGRGIVNNMKNLGIKVITQAQLDKENNRALKALLCAWTLFLLLCLVSIIQFPLFGVTLLLTGLAFLILASKIMSGENFAQSAKELLVNFKKSLELLLKDKVHD
jgi:hypothetical protein